MEKLKLIFIGDKQGVNNFIYKDKEYRPYYVFGEKYPLNTLVPYLTSVDTPFVYKDFLNASIKAGNQPTSFIYACMSEEKGSFYIPISGNKLCKFDMSKIDNAVEEMEQPKPISNEYIIATKNQSIAKMMSLRGCKVLNEGNQFLIIEEDALKYTKKFRDDIKWTLKEGQKIKTATGFETAVIATGKLGKLNGCKVYSSRNNKAYIMISNPKEREILFSEIWYDEKGDVENTPKHQSNRIYEWSIS